MEAYLNRIILIGNGFDLAHKLKTSYKDFIDWFWAERVKLINATKSDDWENFDIGENTYKMYQKDVFFDVRFDEKFNEKDKRRLITDYDPKEKVGNPVEKEADCKIQNVDNKEIRQKPKFISVDDLKSNIVYKNKFLEIVERRKRLQNWVDIEELYFEILKNCKDRYKQSESVYEIYTVEQLNKDFGDIKRKLSEFLKKRNDIISNDNDYRDKLNKDIVDKLKTIISEANTGEILLLNFNYTNTISELYNISNATENQIHGRINDSDNQMIVGYGDEISEESSDIEKLNENAFLENVKSIKYVETDNYSDLLKFIEKDKYEVFVFGHSCGNSDRTLLKALFENINCDKIRCFYFNDDYNKTIDNIYRKFEDKTKFRIKIRKKDKDKDEFPQFDGESPFKDETELNIEPPKEDKPQIEKKPVEKEQSWIEKYNMIEVVFDNTSIAYKNINDDITSKKNLKQNFYIGKYQVTQKEWLGIMGNNPSYFKGDKLPVEHISWYDCIEFCNKLSDKYGLRKYYNITANDVTFNTDADGFRLPTEAEWEYAARGGNKSKNYKYSGSNNAEDVAWYYENSGNKALHDETKVVGKLEENRRQTHEVGQKQPNELGLYDMSGNIWEWCNDRGSGRFLRGGSWNFIALYCRVAFLIDTAPDYRENDYGFRLVLVPKSAEASK